MKPKRALVWVGFWISLAMVFAAGVFRFKGKQCGIEFLTCYAIEWTLSMDNLFVFLMIFRSFGVQARAQLTALKWGIMGAVVMRLGFILIGVTLVKMFSPILYFFGALLLYSAWRMAKEEKGEKDFTKNRLLNYLRQKLSLTKRYHHHHFYFRRFGKVYWTPLILVVVALESSDIMFAIDSIPAAFAITQKPFIIFFANLFAIMGLRSLYFLLAHAEKLFIYLRYGVALILAFVGVKIILQQLHYHIGPLIALGLVLATLLLSMLASVLLVKKVEE